MTAPRIYVWVEKHTIRGEGTRWIGHAMAADGTQLKQIVRPGRDSIKAELADDPGNLKYLEWYTSYEVVWLDDQQERDAAWWRAQFYSEHRYLFRFVDATKVSPPFVEIREERSGKVLAHVVELVLLQSFYVVPGEVSPRVTDEFPEPAYRTLGLAMNAAHKALTPKDEP